MKPYFADKTIQEIIALVLEYWRNGGTASPLAWFNSKYESDDDTRHTFANVANALLRYEANDGQPITLNK